MFSYLFRLSLVTQIVIAIILGMLVTWLFPQAAPYLSLLGDLFIKALKSVAPILVFVLVMASIANFKLGQTAHIKPILMMYMVGMLLAAFSAVFASTSSRGIGRNTEKPVIELYCQSSCGAE
jgi:serine/threonine transporter